jgi:hypothetical protein
LAHDFPGGQAVPQPPQFCALVLTLTQAPEQYANPFAQPHTPAAHEEPPVHA